MNDQRNLKRPLLYLLVGSIILGAVLGIVMVLRNHWGWFETNVILTTIIVAIASLCGLACDQSRTPRGSNLLPNAGLVLALLSAGLLLIGIWADMQTEAFWKVTITVSIFAVTTVHVCLLSIARLAAKFRWVYYISCQVIFGVAMLLTVMILGDFDSPGMFRLLATLSIMDAALTLMIPLLHRISRADEPGLATAIALDERNLSAIDEQIASLKSQIAALEKLRSEIAGTAVELT